MRLNHGLLIRGAYSSNSHNPILKWYPPITQPRGLLIRGWHYTLRVRCLLQTPPWLCQAGEKNNPRSTKQSCLEKRQQKPLVFWILLAHAMKESLVMDCVFVFCHKNQSHSAWVISHVPMFHITQPLDSIRFMVYNGYYKGMSNSPKMGHLPTPVLFQFGYTVFLVPVDLPNNEDGIAAAGQADGAGKGSRNRLLKEMNKHNKLH